MNPFFLVKGVLLGLSIAAPVGPIGVLCIKRTVSQGRATGFVSGLGAATADAIYGFIAAFGLTAISAVLITGRRGIQLIGGLFLLYLGIKTFFSKPTDLDVKTSEKLDLAKAYGATLFLTLTNPMTIISFVGIFAGLGVSGGNIAQSSQIVVGVFIGSALWWLTLSGIVGMVRSRLNKRAFRLINVAAGVVISVFGVIALVRL